MRFLSGASFLCLIAVAMALGLAGCPDKKPKYPNCGSDKDCQDGQHCFNKHCSECSLDEHCESFETCSEGSCTLRDGMCRNADDCSDGKVCKANQCVACESDGECGPGARCSAGACLERGACNQDEDCQDDEDCVDGTCQRPGRTGGPGLSCELKSVYFGFDEYAVAQSGQDVLQENGQCMQQGEGDVLVAGHTDATGTDEYNIALSEKRARSVSDFLARLGIDPGRLRVVPKGESEATGITEDERSQERRVDFEWQ